MRRFGEKFLKNVFEENLLIKNVSSLSSRRGAWRYSSDLSFNELLWVHKWELFGNYSTYSRRSMPCKRAYAPYIHADNISVLQSVSESVVLVLASKKAIIVLHILLFVSLRKNRLPRSLLFNQCCTLELFCIYFQVHKFNVCVIH